MMIVLRFIKSSMVLCGRLGMTLSDLSGGKLLLVQWSRCWPISMRAGARLG